MVSDLFTSKVTGKRKFESDSQSHSFKRLKKDPRYNKKFSDEPKTTPKHKPKVSRFGTRGNKQNFKKDTVHKKRRSNTSNFTNRDNRPIGRQ